MHVKHWCNYCGRRWAGAYRAQQRIFAKCCGIRVRRGTKPTFTTGSAK